MKIRMLNEFTKWFNKIDDKILNMKILKRLDQIEEGNFGDYKSIGDGISEIRINYGPGYRLYYTIRGSELVILLCGGVNQAKIVILKKQKKY